MIASLFASFTATRLGKLLPPWLWIALAGAVIALGGVLWHHHVASDAINTAASQARQQQHDADQKVLDQTVANYRATAQKAAADDAANAQRVEAQQAQISKEQSDDYEARIAAARAQYQRLRDQAASTATRSGGSAATPVSGVSAAPGGPDEAACGAQLPTLDCREAATEQAIQLDALQQWVRKQAMVDVNGNAAKSPSQASPQPR